MCRALKKGLTCLRQHTAAPYGRYAEVHRQTPTLIAAPDNTHHSAWVQHVPEFIRNCSTVFWDH